ncbi:EexN family lipoprotein [Perlucidibaca piscinae]|uniref:EexN family lipoprotein n=1 Tax=Perlucidibaca piscinae TaxID=392589 RepID=UPI0003B33B95|nr:EexN family lipoprotein [Perlucidibaca piscinae]
MRTRLLLMAWVLGLAGCGQPAPEVTVEYLLANPDRLRALQAYCRDRREEVSEKVCAVVSDAQHRRFWGNGQTRYTPGGGVSHE